MQFFRAYRELLFNDLGQEIDAMGNLVDIRFWYPAVGVAASMTANGARSSFFIEKMTGTLNWMRHARFPSVPWTIQPCC